MTWEQKENLDDIYFEAVNGRIPLIGNSCPNCKEGRLHIYVHIFKSEKSEGNDWIKGSGWIWCDHCHCWDHFRAPVPKWWKDAEYLDLNTLDLPPKELSSHVREIDERNITVESRF